MGAGQLKTIIGNSSSKTGSCISAIVRNASNPVKTIPITKLSHNLFLVIPILLSGWRFLMVQYTGSAIPIKKSEITL
jgi:hypothetical protein